MTKKKRELIEILMDNVKPEDWPDSLPYAAQDIKSMNVDYPIYAYKQEPANSSAFPEMWNQVGYSTAVKIGATPKEICKRWNKTIVHRDEFMKRWNERNQIVDSEGWIQWNGGEIPVEKGALIDVKYRDGSMTSEVFYTCDNEFRYSRNWCRLYSEKDIIAYRLHVPQEQKTPQQVALEKFGTDWHENEGVQPVGDKVLIDLIMCNGDEKKKYLANHWSWHKDQTLNIKKWRIHSDDKEMNIDWESKALNDAMEKLNGAQQAFDWFKKAAEAMGGAYIESIISERGNNYGRFEDGAEIMQQLKMIAHTSQGWERMKPVQREAMDMILHKVGRILNGDPSYIDSWVDIEGYSNLVSSWLKGDIK